MFKSLFSLAAVFAISSTSVMASSAPWEQQAPKGMSSAHVEMAAQAAKVHRKVGASGFGQHPSDADWGDWKGYASGYPLSNITASDLEAAITGRYHIRKNPGQDYWSVAYYDPSGITYFCNIASGSRRKEFKSYRVIAPTQFGLAGIYHRKTRKPSGKKLYSWPAVVDAKTGEIGSWGRHANRWKLQTGWLQDEYAPAFAKHCKKLPKVGKVSEQTGNTYQELARGARPIKVKTAFPGSSRNPLTAGMYYHLYPPVR